MRSFMQILAKFCASSIAGCARLRHCTRQQLDAEILQHQNVFAATPAEVLVRCASTAQRICNDFAHFLSENLRNRAAERAIFSARNTAPTCIGAAPTSREFHIGISTRKNAKFGVPRADIEKNLQQFRASLMQMFAKFCACSTLDVCVFGIARTRNSTQKF